MKDPISIHISKPVLLIGAIGSLLFCFLGLFFLFDLPQQVNIQRIENILDTEIPGKVEVLNFEAFKHNSSVDEFFYEVYFIRLSRSSIELDRLINDLNLERFQDSDRSISVPKWGNFGDRLADEYQLGWWTKAEGQSLYYDWSREGRIYLQADTNYIYIYLERSNLG